MQEVIADHPALTLAKCIAMLKAAGDRLVYVVRVAVLRTRPDAAAAVRARVSGGGEGGIRTHGRLAPTEVFKTSALNHSATSPSYSVSAAVTPL